MTTQLHILRVFTGPAGEAGNPLGVFPDGAAIPRDTRQAVAADLGYSETVFVDSAVTGELQIYTPTTELPLAGHPLVGTGWLLGIDTLRPPAGEVDTWREGDLTWIRGRAEWSLPYDRAQLATPGDVDAFAIPGGDAMVSVWAWEDEAAGRIRARVFPNGIGIDEDEATGAHALQLGAQLGRDVVIRQGEGSELFVQPAADGTVAVGGRVVAVAERAYAVPVAA
jgi:predicted PhzF superfamily epimerase YddE/YHI9